VSRPGREAGPLRLYDNPRSSNALKVRFLLAELGLEYERVEVTLASPRPDWYLALNPVGRIPALEDGDLLLSESQAILRYLADREGAEALYPRAPRERAPVDEFLDRFAQTLRPALFRVEAAALGYTPGVGFVPERGDPEKARRVAAEIAETLAVFDGLVAPGGGYALGRFTIADCAAAPALFRSIRTGLDLARHPALARWRETVLARPAFARAEPVM
jgi:glutathione S-transferase